MISTFQRNRHFRKVSLNKTFTHVQEQKSDVAATFRLQSAKCKITFMLSVILYQIKEETTSYVTI